MEFRDGVGQGRFYDIDFRAMQSDPVGEVRGLYRWLGAPMSQEFEDAMQRWWATNSAGREESRHSDPAVYGLNLDQVRERFADYATQSPLWTAHGEPTLVNGR